MAIRDCKIEPSDDPELDRSLLAQIFADGVPEHDDCKDWNEFLVSIGEDPDE